MAGGMGGGMGGGIAGGAGPAGGSKTGAGPQDFNSKHGFTSLGNEMEILDPAEARYVDENFEAMTAANLRNLAAGNNPSNLSLAVAKRMPVRMRLLADQRKLHDLLSACGNSSFVVQVRQLRFDPETTGGTSRNQRGGGFGEMGRGGGAMRSFGTATAGSATGMGSGSGSGAPIETYDHLIELYGIIYIYNPVDEKLLGYDQATNL